MISVVLCHKVSQCCFASQINCLRTVSPNIADPSSAVMSVSAFSVTGTPGVEREPPDPTCSTGLLWLVTK